MDTVSFLLGIGLGIILTEMRERSISNQIAKAVKVARRKKK